MLGRRRNNAHITHSHHGHVKSAWYRGCRQGQNIYGAPDFFQFLLVFNTKALLFIKHNKPQIFKSNIFLDKPVGSYNYIYLSGLKPIYNCTLLADGTESA